MSSSYDWIAIRSPLVDPNALHQRYAIPDDQANFQDGRYNVPTTHTTVWTLTIVHAVLLRNFVESTTALDLLSEAFGCYGHYVPRAIENLTQDLKYFKKFAELRNMLETPVNHPRINLETLPAAETSEIMELLKWMIGRDLIHYDLGYIGLHLISKGAASRLAQDTINMGLQISLSPSVDDLACKRDAGFMVLRCRVRACSSSSSTSALRLTPCPCETTETLVPVDARRKSYFLPVESHPINLYFLGGSEIDVCSMRGDEGRIIELSM
jgi:hypothetical protein